MSLHLMTLFTNHPAKLINLLALRPIIALNCGIAQQEYRSADHHHGNENHRDPKQEPVRIALGLTGIVSGLHKVFTT